jgi:pimeloyl-ACP methyl ester carboxylesterase
MTRQDAGHLTGSMVDTSRLRQHVWTSGPDDGRPLLLVHGNISTGGFWRYVAEQLPDDVRVIAPDLRSFGLTEAKLVDATRGLRDMADDVHDLLETLGLAGRGTVHAAGWSMGGGVLQQLLIDHPDDLAGLTLMAPLSPYGFGGCRDADGRPCTPDWAGTGGGTAAPAFVRRLAERDASSDDPTSAPREVLLAFFGPGANRPHVDEDFLVAELLTTTVGDDHYPGDATPSEHWPNTAPGTRGVMNSMSGKYDDTSAFGDLRDGPPITWLRATADQVVSDRSMFDLATLGELGVVAGWPGADAMPPQPMETQLRTVLERYAGNGGRWREVVLEGVGHGIPLEVPDVVATEIVRTMADA